jgi:hypothetical protein
MLRAKRCLSTTDPFTIVTRHPRTSSSHASKNEPILPETSYHEKCLLAVVDAAAGTRRTVTKRSVR